MSVRRWPVLGLALAVLWVFVRGVRLRPAKLVDEFAIGLVVGLGVAAVVRRMYPTRIEPGGLLRRIPPAVLYAVLFVKEIVTANVDVAMRVLSPWMPIEPDVVELPLRVETDAGITTIANSITLTPGTLTMDYDAERNALYVHAIYCPDPEAVVAPIRRWEDLALRIFDEDAAPSEDPRPARLGSRHGPTDAASGGDADGE